MPLDLIKNLNGKYTKSTKANYWDNSIFRDIVKLTNDERGRWGEEFLFELVKEYTDFNIYWDCDKNTNPLDGIYDLWIVKNIEIKTRIEVKTSGRTISKSKPIGWQHENVYYCDNQWDKLVFIDYDSNDVIYVTIVDYDQIVVDNQIDLTIFGKKGHCRKNENGKAKVDFSMKSINKGLDIGITFKHDLNNPSDEKLKTFLIEKLK